jgi:HEAT repeat protein
VLHLYSSGLEPLLPIYQRGILYGTPAIREASAAGLGEAISLTAPKFLAGPIIIKMTGPLLRIVGDRNPSNVKIAILRTLGLILVKGGPALRAFVPQFQTTFVKALSDPSRQVRLEAIQALGLLMPLSTRLDPLLKELVAGALGKGAANTDAVGSVAIQTATLEALAVVLREGGKKAKLPDSITAALNAGKELLSHSDEDVREAAAKVVGCACGILGLETATDFVRSEILGGSNDDWEQRHGTACAIRRICSASIAKELDSSLTSDVMSLAQEYMNDDKATVKEAAYIAIGAVIARMKDPTSTLRSIERELLQAMGNSKERMETHQAIASGLCLSLELVEVKNRVDFMGLALLNACLKLAMSGAQRVQFAFNDTLYRALDVGNGQDGLDHFSSIAMFEDTKQMKSVYSKVLVKMKDVKSLTD